MSASADRNLLFGILALQMDFVTRDQLVAAMNAWVLDKAKPLGDILRGQNALDDDTHALLEALLQKHLANHGNDPAASLAAVSSLGPANEDLRRIADPEVQASLAAVGRDRVAPDPAGTASLPTGTGTVGGVRFRVLRPHARGALGQVSVAIDEELHREVALKEIQEQHADHADSRARFLLEAEVTGGLEHPGVVPVYGLGTYADGRPFYAMRFIRGNSLHDAIKQFHAGHSNRRFDSLEFRQLLGRFIDVCQAIAYAHSRGVLHRDLKPGNVMLGKYGETLVVDWGLAKPTGRTPGDGSGTEGPLRPASAVGSSATVLGSAVGTPAYMSPEQADGRPDGLGLASDVYSLGATLYELLTGRRPFVGDNIEEILAKVRRGDCPPPRSTQAAVPRALEAICLKAMAVRPPNRYAGTLELAADVEHWLADEPVTAWREPVGPRMRRWVRKHSRLVTGATVAFLVASAGLGLLALEREWARAAVANERAATASERDIAREQKRRTRAALDTMVSVDMIERLGSQKELTKGQREFLQTALDYYREFAADAATDEEGRKLEADAHFSVGFLLQALGQKEDAATAYRRALPIYESLAADFSAMPDYRRELGRSHGSLGTLLRDLGQRPAAESEYRAALSVFEKLAADFPSVAAHQRQLAGSHNNLGLLLNLLGRRVEAETEYRAALAVQEKLVADFPREAQYRNDLAASHVNLGNLLRDLGEPAAAEGEFRAALAISEAIAADFPAVPDHRSALANCHNSLGVLLGGLGRRAAAEAEFQAALAMQEKLVRDFPAVPDHRRRLAKSHVNMGNLLAGSGQKGVAEVQYRAALAVQEKLANDFPAVPDYRNDLGQCRDRLGVLLCDLGQWTAAEAEYRAALAIQAKLAADFPGDPNYRVGLAAIYANFARLLHNRGDEAAALSWVGKAIEQLGPIVAADPRPSDARRNLCIAHWGRAAGFTRLKRYAEALPDWEAALELDDGSGRLQIRVNRAGCFAFLGRAADAVHQADELTADPATTAASVYDCACVISFASAAPNNPAADVHAARAVAVLRQAIAKGYADIPHLLVDADLAPLRGRADYADLLWDLADMPAQNKR